MKSLNRLVRVFSYCNVSDRINIPGYSTLRQLQISPSIQYVCKREFQTCVKRNASMKEASETLQKLLQVKISKTHYLILKDKTFSKISTEGIEKNFELCINFGLTKETLTIYPNILADPNILVKLDTLKLLYFNINKAAPLFSVKYVKLKNFVFDEQIERRVATFAELFEVDESEVCKWFSKKQFLMSINLDNVKTTTNLLLESGVTKRAIIDDLWVLRYSASIIKERIILAKENNIDVLKTWMVRAQREIFDNYVRRRSDNKEILGEKTSLIEYLSEKLECSQDVSKFLISKQPALQKKSLRKMNEMIDFLLLKGFKPIQICRIPKIMLHSVETIKKRLKEIEANDMQIDSLAILTKSQRQYMHVLDSMKSNKNKLKN